jgi:GNAT superfamily N-acetyltransferase
MLIRAAMAADIPLIEQVVTASYGGYVARIGKPPGPMLDDYAAHVSAGRAWVLESAGDVIGVLILASDGAHLLLDNVAVLPAHHGKGHGRALLAFAEAEARRRGHGEMRLYTHALMHENIAMYARAGWIEYARGEQAGYQRVFMRKLVN